MIIGLLCFIAIYIIVFIINYKLICIGNQLWPEQALDETLTIGFSCMFLLGTVLVFAGLIFVLAEKTEVFKKIGSFCRKFLKKIENCPPNFK